VKSNIIKGLILLTGLTIVVSCSSEKKDGRLELVEYAWSQVSNGDLASKKALLIIPNAGCGGCITSAENFAIEAIESMPDLIIIFTGTSSQKQLRLKLGNEVYNHSNVRIDSKDYFYEGELYSVYPLVVYLRNGSPVKIVEQSPFKENTLDSLQSYLISNKF